MADPRNPASIQQSYSTPQHATPGALGVFDEWVQEKAARATERFDYLAKQNQQGNHVPKLNAEVMNQVLSDIDGNQTSGGGRRNLAVIADILLTVAIVGLTVMANFLSHSSWQLVLFACFVIVGGVGIALTWRARHIRARKR